MNPATKIAEGLNLALDGIGEVLARHGPECSCPLCDDALGMEFTLRLYLESFEALHGQCLTSVRKSLARMKEKGLLTEGQAARLLAEAEAEAREDAGHEVEPLIVPA